ncbi:MAG: ABC transporter ATP-binding protein [Eubacteriales bacterium]|nr:ABC transporter ATP-binding protein [Eubacteriales bacterium]
MMPNEESGKVHVLKGLNFSIYENEFVGIMGKSGCGKTTLLKTLGLIDPPTAGELYFKGTSVKELWEDELSDIRRRNLGFVFQDFYLMDSLTLEENIMLPMILDKKEEKECYESARLYAEHFQISHLLKKYPFEISGGEKQRTAICRALVNSPDLILADEPTGNLDSASGRIVVEALENIHQNMKKTIVMVTHDPQVASHCDRILFLKDGTILEDARKESTTEDFYQFILNKMSDL